MLGTGFSSEVAAQDRVTVSVKWILNEEGERGAGFYDEDAEIVTVPVVLVTDVAFDVAAGDGPSLELSHGMCDRGRGEVDPEAGVSQRREALCVEPGSAGQIEHTRWP